MSTVYIKITMKRALQKVFINPLCTFNVLVKGENYLAAALLQILAIVSPLIPVWLHVHQRDNAVLE